MVNASEAATGRSDVTPVRELLCLRPGHFLHTLMHMHRPNECVETPGEG